jgi:hypothetical protein
MARWSLKSATWTPVAVADTVAYTDNGYIALQGGSGTQVTQIWEVNMGGQATSSAPTIMLLSRDSTVGVTLTALAAGQSNAALDPATAALAAPPVGFTASTTKPQRSATLGILNVSFNLFGGIYRWCAPDEHGTPRMLGNTASFGEMSLSAYTGTAGLLGTHIIYEPL